MSTHPERAAEGVMSAHPERAAAGAMSAHPLTITALERWMLFGATWQIVDISDEHAVIDLCSCTGELVERRESADPTVVDYLRRDRPPRD
jgi:hypothetical protein